MANKGHSECGLFGSINHYDEQGRKLATVNPASLVAIITTIARVIRLAILIQACSEATIITIAMEEKPDIVIRGFSAATIIGTATEKLPAPATPACLEAILTMTAKVVMLPPVYTVAMIVHRYGRCGDSVMKLLQNHYLAERSFAHTTQSVRLS